MRAWARRGLLALACFVSPLAAAAQLSLDVGDLDFPGGHAKGIRFSFTPWGSGPGTLQAEALQVAGRDLGPVRVECARLLVGAVIECQQGRLASPRAGAPGWAVRLRYESGTAALDLTVSPARGERWLVKSRRAAGARETVFEVQSGQLARLTMLWPALEGFSPAGVFNGRATLAGPKDDRRLAVSGTFEGVSFATPEGREAGEKIVAGVSLSANFSSGIWQGQGAARWRAGELYVEPVYLAAGAGKMEPTLSLRAQLAGGVLSLSDIDLDLGDAGRWSGRMSWDLASGQWRAGQVQSDWLALGALGPMVINPWLARVTPQKVTWGGRVKVSAERVEGGWQAAAGELDGVGVSVGERDGHALLGLEGLRGSLAWRADASTRNPLQIDAIRLGALQSGAFSLPIEVTPRGVSVAAVEVPLLDGALVGESITLERHAQGWAGEATLSTRPVSMALLTQALGLPPMSGVFSASLPRLRSRDGVLSTEGAVVVTAFDGFISMTGLKVFEPFGRTPRLFADIEARNLDLALMTEAYQFGSITGRLDVEARQLELQDWQPHAFLVTARSSPGDYPRRISQRAVENLTALGGGSAQAVLQRGMLSLFKDFGYRRLGVSCVLKDGVCLMDGTGRATDGGFLIVEGGGVPALNVVGYNRVVDWGELVSRLKRVVAQEKK